MRENEKYLVKITTDIIKKEKSYLEAESDTEDFWDLAQFHRLNQVIYNQIDSENMDYILASRQRYKLESEVYSLELKKVCHALKIAGIEYRVVKGVFLSQKIYNDFWFRNIGDIDIVVNETDLEKAFFVIRDLGFESFGNLGDDKPKLILGLFFCEIKMIKRNMVLEIKRGVSSIDTSFNPWFTHSQKVLFEGQEIDTLDLNHTVLLMFAQVFINNEGKVIFYKCRLREYFDVAYFIVNHPDFNWEELIALSEEYEITHQIFAVIKSVNEIYPLSQIFLDKITALICLDKLPYEKTFFYYNEDKRMEFNEGLLVQRFRANANYTIFDKDFAVYQYVKNYKAVLYSKRNHEYKNKIKISEGQQTPWIDYSFNDKDVQMKYRYKILPDNIMLEVLIDMEHTACFEENDISIRAAWYNNDITSCMLQQHVDSGIINVDCLDEDTQKQIAVVTRDYYTPGSEYSVAIGQVNQSIGLHLQKGNGKLKVEFLFDRDFLFGVLDHTAFEVKLMQNHTQTIAMSMGSTVEVISLN